MSMEDHKFIRLLSGDVEIGGGLRKESKEAEQSYYKVTFMPVANTSDNDKADLSTAILASSCDFVYIAPFSDFAG